MKSITTLRTLLSKAEQTQKESSGQKKTDAEYRVYKLQKAIQFRKLKKS